MTCFDVPRRSAKPHLLWPLVNSAETISDKWPLLCVALPNFDISVVIFQAFSPFCFFNSLEFDIPCTWGVLESKLRWLWRHQDWPGALWRARHWRDPEGQGCSCCPREVKAESFLSASPTSVAKGMSQKIPRAHGWWASSLLPGESIPRFSMGSTGWALAFGRDGRTWLAWDTLRSFSFSRCWTRASPSLVLSTVQPTASMVFRDSLAGQR